MARIHVFQVNQLSGLPAAQNRSWDWSFDMDSIGQNTFNGTHTKLNVFTAQQALALYYGLKSITLTPPSYSITWGEKEWQWDDQGDPNDGAGQWNVSVPDTTRTENQGPAFMAGWNPKIDYTPEYLSRVQPRPHSWTGSPDPYEPLLTNRGLGPFGGNYWMTHDSAFGVPNYRTFTTWPPPLWPEEPGTADEDRRVFLSEEDVYYDGPGTAEDFIESGDTFFTSGWYGVNYTRTLRIWGNWFIYWLGVDPADNKPKYTISSDPPDTFSIRSDPFADFSVRVEPAPMTMQAEIYIPSSQDDLDNLSSGFDLITRTLCGVPITFLRKLTAGQYETEYQTPNSNPETQGGPTIAEQRRRVAAVNSEWDIASHETW